MKPVAALETGLLEGQNPPQGPTRSRSGKAGTADAFASALDRARRAGKAGRGERDDEGGAPMHATQPSAHAVASAHAVTTATLTATATSNLTATATSNLDATATSTPTAAGSSPSLPAIIAEPDRGELGAIGAHRAAQRRPTVAAGEAEGGQTAAARAEPRPSKGGAASRQAPSFRASPAPASRALGKASDPEAATRSPLGDAVARAGRERIAREPERAAHRPDAKLRAPDAPAQPGPAHAQPAQAAQASAPDAPRAAAAPLVPALAAAPRGDVTGAILPAAAHLRVSSDVLGEVTLHLRVRDGAAHLRVEAGATSPVQARAPELARALAAEGLTLAKLEVEPRAPAPAPAAPQEGSIRPDAGGGGRQARDDRQPQDELPGSRRSTAPRSRPQRPGGHHVTA